jgi:hypothetical protein
MEQQAQKKIRTLLLQQLGTRVTKILAYRRKKHISRYEHFYFKQMQVLNRHRRVAYFGFLVTFHQALLSADL